MKRIVIVIPVFDEQEVLPRLWDRLRPILDQLRRQRLGASVFFIDDGSSDGTLPWIRSLAKRDKRVRYLSFSRNFGHQAAVMAGLCEAEADAYVVMDGDLQDPPEVLPELVGLWHEGWEVVNCVRIKRKANPLKKLAYSLFYRLLASMSYLPVTLDSGDFSLLDRCAVKELRRMGERNPFVRGMRTWIGFRQCAYEYERPQRAGGDSKYSLRQLFALAYDGLFSFSFAPLKMAMHLGFLIAAMAFLAICYLLGMKFISGISLKGWTSTVVLILFMGGIQLLTLGFIGEYLARVFNEVKARPLYIVKERR